MAINPNNSILQSIKLNNATVAANASLNMLTNRLNENNSINIATPSTYFESTKPRAITQTALAGMITIYQGIPSKLDRVRAIDIPIDIEKYNSKQEYPIKVEKTITNIVSNGIYSLRNSGFRDRDIRIISVQALSNGAIVDAISRYSFNGTGSVKIYLKDISNLNLTELIFRVIYTYTKNSGSLKFISKDTEFKKKYKIYGPYKMKGYSYDLTDISGYMFSKYKPIPDSDDSDVDPIITTPTCNSTNSVGIDISYIANPYDINQWIEKREIYYIPSDLLDPTISLMSRTKDILKGSPFDTKFYKTSFVQDNSILQTIPYALQTMAIPRSLNDKNTFQGKFKKDGVYEADAIRLLRGDIVAEEVFFNKRKKAMEDSLTDLMTGYDEDYRLADEYFTSNGKDRVYNFAKGFSNMVNQEALNVKDDIVIKRALQDSETFNYQVIFERKNYDANIINRINQSTDDDSKEQEEALLRSLDFSFVGSRNLLERLAQASQYPIEKVYEKDYSKKIKRDIALANGDFSPERNTHLQYYNITKPKLDNSLKKEYANTTFNIAKDMLYTGFRDLFFKDIFLFKEIPNEILNSISKVDSSLPVGDTDVSYKIVYSNSEEEVAEIDDLITGLIKPDNGTKLEVYYGR